MNEFKNHLIIDIEVYPNFYYICGYDLDEEKYYEYQQSGDNLLNILNSNNPLFEKIRNMNIVTFNGHHYDLPIIYKTMFSENMRVSDVYKLSLDIIENNKYYKYDKDFITNHIDLFKISVGAPIKTGLKTYGCRINSIKIGSLPFPYDKNLKASDIAQLKSYCKNDVIITRDLLFKNAERLKARKKIKLQQACMLSDSQIAEQFYRLNNIQKNHASYPPDYSYKEEFKLLLDNEIWFHTDEFKEVYNYYKNLNLIMSTEGRLINHSRNHIAKLKINNLEIKTGLGGLHSLEKNIIKKECYSYDVSSYYPFIILNNKFGPVVDTEDFLETYKGLIKRRLKAKEDDIALSEILKIVINGTFGKFASPYSVLYNPKIAYSITVNGQLYLLNLIEELYLDGIEIISANTDGIIIDGDYNKIDKHLTEWEEKFNFSMDETLFSHYIARDVNNYFGLITEENKIKAKGIFNTNFDLNRNVNGNIIYDSIIEYFIQGRSVSDKIKSSELKKPEDFYKYLFMRSSKTECYWRDEWLGRNFRWYVSKNGEKIVNDVGHKVANSDNAVPVQDLSKMTVFNKNDIDYKHYRDAARKLITQLEKGMK